jgi:hypothetical protein
VVLATQRSALKDRSSFRLGAPAVPKSVSYEIQDPSCKFPPPLVVIL